MGLPRVLGKTRSLSCHPSPFLNLSSFCRALCAPSAASTRVVSLRVRLLLRFFGVLYVPSTSRERFTESVPSSKSISDHLSPKTSPRLSPVHTATTYKASRRPPRAPSSNVLTSLESRAWGSLAAPWSVSGGFTPSVGLRGIRSSPTASLSALRNVVWIYESVRLERPSSRFLRYRRRISSRV